MRQFRSTGRPSVCGGGAHTGLDGPLDGGDLGGLGELPAVGATHVEGIDHGRPEGGDLGRGDVEVALDEGPGDPVELADVTAGELVKKASGRNRGRYQDQNADQEKGFSIIVQDRNGALYKRVYGFSGYHVRLISKTPVTRRDTLLAMGDAPAADAEPSTAAEGGWWQKMMRRWRRR